MKTKIRDPLHGLRSLLIFLLITRKFLKLYKIKRGFLFASLWLCSACLAYAQQGLPVLVTSTTSGKIYEINVNNCEGRFICTTNTDLNDIAFTPDGKLWGRTADFLFRIDTVTGNVIPIGAAPPGNALVGLNDSTLLIDSLNYLFSIKTTDASTHLIGNTGHNAEGDYTWIGKYLYMSAYNSLGNIIKITLDSTYSEIQKIDTIVDISNPWEAVTLALASVNLDNIGYTIIAFRGDTAYYRINPESGDYQLLCSGLVVSTSGAASMLFPPSVPTAIEEHSTQQDEMSIYPNPVINGLYININTDNRLNPYKIVITDMVGRALLIKNSNRTHIEMNISTLTSGMYFVLLKDRSGHLIGISKIIKI